MNEERHNHNPRHVSGYFHTNILKMNFQLNTNLGNWLTQLNGKTVDRIYQVDFNNNRHSDIYLPWLFFITFSGFDCFLEVEGDNDGEHLKINLHKISVLENKLKEYNFPEEIDLWSVYETEKNETLGNLLGQKIEFIEYGIDKDQFQINGSLVKGQKDAFNFIKFNCEKINLTIFEGSLTGLGISDDANFKLNFEETFEKYSTKHKNNR